MTNFKEFFTRLFLNTDSQDSFMAWLLLGVTALLGLFFGWLLRGGKVKRLKNQLSESDQKYKLLHSENAGLEDQFKQQSVEVRERTARIETMEDNMQSYEQNQFKLRNSLQAAQAEVEQLNKAQMLATASSNSYEDKILALENQAVAYESKFEENNHTIQQLQTQIQKFQTENKQVEEELERLMDNKNTIITPSGITMKSAFSKIDALENRVRQMEDENRVLQSSVLEVKTESGDMVAKEDLHSLRARINILSEENKDLKKQVTGIKGTGTSETDHRTKLAQLEIENKQLRSQLSSGSGLTTNPYVNPTFSTPNSGINTEPIIPEEDMTDEVDRQQVELLKTQKSQFGVMGDRIEVEAIETPTYPKNDLTKIEGIGPFIEKKLNEVGITSFKQLAIMDQSEINRVTSAIQFFPGRIERDNWVGQAGKLVE